MTLLTSPFYLAGIGAVVAMLLAAASAHARISKRTQPERAFSPPDVPLGAQARSWNYSEILEYTHDAIIIWEMDGEGVVYWNRAAEQIYGFDRREAAGQTTHVLLKTHLEGGVNQLEAKLARYGVWAGELKHTTKDGRQITVQSRLALMSQHNGRWLVLEVNRDLTDDPQSSAQSAVQAHLSTLRRKSLTVDR